LTPLAESRIADAYLAADLLDLRAQFRLLEGKCNLLLRKPALLNGMPLIPSGESYAGFSASQQLDFLGQGHLD
jgi:hypothetical protein